MAWETRRNGRYYYRKRKVAGQVISEYVGSGLSGELSALTDGRERHDRIMARLALEEFIQEQRRIDRLLNEHRGQVKKLVAAVLQEAGFRQHKRGEWRKARSMGNRITKIPTKEEVEEEVTEYNRLYLAGQNKKANSAEINRLREYADEHSHLFDGFSMLSGTTTDAVIEAASKDEATRVHIHAEMKAFRRDLGYDAATPLERLLIKDASLCWIRLLIFEQIYSREFGSGNGISFAKAAYLENRLSATRRRYHQAIESLAHVQGLVARAGVQINIAQQQLVQNK